MLGQHLGNTVIQIAHYTDLLPNPPDPRSTLIQTSHKHVAARQQQQDTTIPLKVLQPRFTYVLVLANSRALVTTPSNQTYPVSALMQQQYLDMQKAGSSHDFWHG